MPRQPYSRRILVREGRAEPATSVRGATPHSAGQQSDPRSDRPAGAGWAALRQFRFWGANDRCMLPPPAARWDLRGIAKQAALKDQRYRAPSTLLAPNPRARGARRASDVGPRSDPSPSAGQQSDPRSGRPARAGWAALRQFRFSGRERSIMLPPPAARWDATGYRQTRGTERSALSCPVDLTRAESSCARGAPSQRRRSAERPTFSWSAERPAIRPTRWRRLGGASAISFLGRERSIMLPPPAARWELRGIAKQAALKDQRYRAPST